MDRRSFLTSTSQAAFAFGIFRRVPQLARPRVENPPFAALRERYFLKFLELNPVTSTYLGGDGYSDTLADVNGRLRDYNVDAIADEVRFYRGIEDALTPFDPATLNDIDRVDHQVMSAQLRYVVHQLAERRYQERCVDTYVEEPFRGVDWQIQQMQDLGNGLLGTEDEWSLVAQRVEGIPAYLDTARANLRAGKAQRNLPDWRMIEFDGITSSRAAAEYFGKTLGETATRYLGARPFASALDLRLAAAGQKAADAYLALGAFLVDQLATGDRVDRFAAGEAEYQWRVKNCLQDPRTVAELYEYGAAQVALYEKQIFDVARKVARDAGLSVSFSTPAERRAAVRAVMDFLSQDSPANDDQLFAWYRESAARAVDYGRQQRLFDVPADYRLDIVPTPPVLQSTIGAAYYPAPPFKRSGVGRFYLTPTGNDAAQLKLNNRASVADTAVHEGFPGHDWHFKYMTLHAAEISNVRWLTPGAVEDSFSMWEDSMATEGWALYSEELMAEPVAERPHGFYSPAEHLYELQGQLLRAVRVRVDVGIHTGRMSFDEAVNYFAEHVDFYPDACARATTDPTARAVCDGARKAMYRYSKWPTQAITYNLGKNAIVALREATRKKLGTGFSAQRFHERFMAMGTIPAGYFREVFLSGA